MQKYDLVVIGGGAAGFFGAINACIFRPGLRVAIVEKTTKWLTKVKVSGGGRCNVTHKAEYVSHLVKSYPRGGKFLKKVFGHFSAPDTVAWFEKHGVHLKTEADGRMFPVTDSSQTVVDCLLRLAAKHNIELRQGFAVTSVRRMDKCFEVASAETVLLADKVLVTIGGQPKADGFEWIRKLGHSIEPPVPSLFTFNTPDDDFRELAGVSVPLAEVKIAGQPLSAAGPLLITHWGFSGPAILRLSAWGARDLAGMGYVTTFLVNWLGDKKEEALKQEMDTYLRSHPKRAVSGHPLYGLPSRLWTKLVERAGVAAEKRWLDLGNKDKNRLVEVLIRCPFEMKGKTTFKEEFVTCGGVNLDEVDPNTMESRLVPGLYFAGEVLDVDGITGGFNFQNAWSGAWVAAKAVADGHGQV